MGSQAGHDRRQARQGVRSSRSAATGVREALEAGKIAIVAGFQGISPTTRDVTTLGRGGSDTTAVALAAALAADVREIYTDVDGVYTPTRGSSPARGSSRRSRSRRCSSSRRGRRVSRCARSKTLKPRVKFTFRSSFNESEGTWILKEEDMLEQADHLGDRARQRQAKVTIRRVPDRPGIASPDLQAARGCRGQRRHDRAEHLGRRRC